MSSTWEFDIFLVENKNEKVRISRHGLVTTSTLSQLQKAIEKECGIPVDKQRIQYEDQGKKDVDLSKAETTTISDAGLYEGDSLFVGGQTSRMDPEKAKTHCPQCEHRYCYRRYSPFFDARFICSTGIDEERNSKENYNIDQYMCCKCSDRNEKEFARQEQEERKNWCECGSKLGANMGCSKCYKAKYGGK